MHLEAGLSPPYPETERQDLLDCLFELGPQRSGEALSFNECLAFAKVVFLSEWDVRTLYQMSRSYAAEAITARDKFAIPPADREDAANE